MLAFLIMFLMCAVLYSRPELHTRSITHEDYLSRKRTSIINAFFIVFVFICHIQGYDITPNKVESIALHVIPRGQLLVTPFLFFSGYGIMCSFMNKGSCYAAALLKSRFPTLWLNFIIAVSVFGCVNVFLVGKNYTISDVLLSYCTWQSLGNSNWYIGITLLAYLLISIAYYAVGRRGYLYMIVTLTFMMIAALVVIGEFKGSYWVDTALCVPAGMAFCLYRSSIQRILEKLPIPTILIGIALICLGSLTHRSVFGLAILANVGSILYALGVCLTQSCITWKKPTTAMVWLGGPALFYLYIFQRLPMIIGKYFGWNIDCRNLYIAGCFAATIALAWLLIPLFKRIDKLLFAR